MPKYSVEYLILKYHHFNFFPPANFDQVISKCKFCKIIGPYRLRRTVVVTSVINPLNAELNPICHLPILLGDLTFMGKCIISISNKMQSYTVYLYLETALHISGGASTHHQESLQLYLQHLVFVTPLLLSAAVVEELEPG
jgi:hypothetical protein